MTISPVALNTKNTTIKESVNIQIPLVIQWFIESEQCMWGANAVRIPSNKAPCPYEYDPIESEPLVDVETL